MSPNSNYNSNLDSNSNSNTNYNNHMSPMRKDRQAGEEPSNLLTSVLEKTLDPVQNPDHQHRTTGVGHTVDDDDHEHAMSMSNDMAGGGQATPTTTTTTTGSKPSFRRLASAGLNKPFQIAGSIKRGFSSNKAHQGASTTVPSSSGLSVSNEQVGVAAGRNSLEGQTGEGSVPPPAESTMPTPTRPITSTSTSTSTSADAMRLKPSLKPLDNEPPLAILRVRVLRATSLSSRDRNGLSDPYLVLSLPPTPNRQTPSVKKSLNPSWEGEKEQGKSTFDFPLYESLGKGAGMYEGRGLEVVVWDRDFGGVRKDYMGEVCVRLAQWEEGGLVWKENMESTAHDLHSTRRKRRDARVSGAVHLQLGLLPPPGETPLGLTEEWAKEVVRKLSRTTRGQDDAELRRLKDSLLAAPAYEGVGTVKMRPRRRKRAIPKSALQSAARTLFHRKDRRGRNEKDGGDASETLALSDDADDASDSDVSSSGSEEALQDDGLSDTASEVDDGDVYSMGFLVPDRTRRGTASTLSSMTDKDRTGSMSGGQIAPMQGHTIDEHEMAQFSTSPEHGLTRIHTDTAAPVIVEIPPTAAKEVPPGYFDKMLPSSTAGGSKSNKRRPSKDPLIAAHNSHVSTYSEKSSGSGLLTPSSTVPAEASRLKKRLRKVRRKGTAGTEYNLGVNKDVLGIVMLEISGAKDLPKLRNSLKFTFDMDPFVVISFGKKVFRTRVIRHELNPNWDEKMLFHVRRYEDNYNIQFAVLDWDKVSGNDFIGSSTISLQDLIKDAPLPDEQTGLYGPRVDGKHEMREFALPIATPKESGWESRHSPVLHVRAKYEPYDALRQRFWRQYLLQFDSDNTGSISFTELTTMLDSLNSTLTNSTLESYFTRFDKDPEQDELSFDEIIRCLEDEIKKSASEKKHLRSEPPSGMASPSSYPAMAPYPASDGLDESGPSARAPSGVDADELAAHIKASRPTRDDDDSPNGDINVKPVHMERSGGIDAGQHVQAHDALSPGSTPDVSDSESDVGHRGQTERVINIKSCPLCHRPRLKKKSEADILTHIAVCASADWDRVDRIVVGNYVTASQAQRKFFSKVLTKVSAGAYSLGANSANIIVQDRMTGQLQEEKMAVYVRIGIRVLYKGAKKGMEGARAQRLLKSMSIKQGIKYNSPESKADIPTFVAYHKLNVDEIKEPLDSFKTFNEFFYRRLKADARPITHPEDPTTLVSCADCRMMAFESVSEATRLWIKGKEFSVGRLLGDSYQGDWQKYEGGALGIFRLAPQDYHRYHSPVDGVIGKPTRIEGQYYTVNPQAIRTTLDVYGENVREVWPIQSPQFGTVMTVWIGAMMVGSIGATVKEGDSVKRGDELGWFAFGGSTIVCLFEKGKLRWDEDILNNSSQAIETLVRMGMGIGKVASEDD